MKKLDEKRNNLSFFFGWAVVFLSSAWKNIGMTMTCKMLLLLLLLLFYNLKQQQHFSCKTHIVAPSASTRGAGVN